MHRQFDAGPGGHASCPGARRVDHRGALDAAAVGQSYGADVLADHLETVGLGLQVARPQRARLATQGLQQAPAVEPAFAGQAQRGQRHTLGGDPRESRAQLLRVEQRHLGAQLALQLVIAAQDRLAGARGQEQVTGFAQADFGPLALHLEQFSRTPQELHAVAAQFDVDARGELLAYRAGRQGRGGARVARVALDDDDLAGEVRIGAQEIGDGAADGAAADDGDGSFHVT